MWQDWHRMDSYISCEMWSRCSLNLFQYLIILVFGIIPKPFVTEKGVYGGGGFFSKFQFYFTIALSIENYTPLLQPEEEYQM